MRPHAVMNFGLLATLCLPLGCSDTGDGGGATDGSSGSAEHGDSDATGSEDSETGADLGTESGSESTGASSETGADPEPDTDSETGAEESAPCPAYSGLANVGSTWETSSTPAYDAAYGFPQDTHREVTSVEFGETTTVTTVATTTIQGANYFATTVATSVYTCDDEGAWLQSVITESTGASGGSPFDFTCEFTYTPPWYVMPWDVQVGSSWTASSAVTTVTNGGSPQTSMTTNEHEVIGSSTVEAQAGTFDVLEITWSDGSSSGSWFSDAEVGELAGANGDFELIAVDIVPW